MSLSNECEIKKSDFAAKRRKKRRIKTSKIYFATFAHLCGEWWG